MSGAMCQEHASGLPCWRCEVRERLGREHAAKARRAWLESEVRRAIGGLVPVAAGRWAYARQELLRELAEYVEQDPGFLGETGPTPEQIMDGAVAAPPGALALAAGMPPLGYPTLGAPTRPGATSGQDGVVPAGGLRGRAAWEAELAGVVEELVGMLEGAEERGRVGAAAEERARLVANMRAHRMSEATIDRMLGVDREGDGAARGVVELRAALGLMGEEVRDG